MFHPVIGGRWSFGGGRRQQEGAGVPPGFDAKSWQPPDGLSYTRSRPIRLAPGGIALIVVAALSIAGGVFGSTVAATTAKRQTRQIRELQNQGELAEAVITRLWRSSGKDEQHYVAYRFTDSRGTVYDSRATTPRGIWQSLRQGASLPVRFLPSDPTVSHPEGWVGEAIPAFVPYLIVAMAAIAPLVLSTVLRRQARLLSEGRPAPGFVTRHRRADHGKTRNYYEFILLNGATAKGRSESRKALPMNTPICILYDPDNPRRNAPYPLSLVKLANLQK